MATQLISFDDAIEDSKKYSKRHLIVGNGFSISARPGIFTYGSLFNQSGIKDDERLVAVFEALSTTDFEVAIRALETSASLVPIYSEDYHEARRIMEEDAARLKDILIETVAENHPDGPYDMTQEEFQSCSDFLSNFMAGDHEGIVFTVNYDLLLYWTLMNTRDEEDRLAWRVDDGFGNDDDDPEADYVVWHGETRAHTPKLYYLHGALHLFDASHKLQKFTWVRTGERLKEQSRAAMNDGRFPLFVAEGTSDQKYDRIRHSAYLYQGLKTLFANANKKSHCFFVHGHSLAQNDAHIFNLIGRGKCQTIYVSVHGELSSEGNQKLVHNVRAIQALRGERAPLEVEFYDASSARVWNRYGQPSTASS